MVIFSLGLDIRGPFPGAAGEFEFLFIANDNFTKWLEVDVVRMVTAQSAIKFLTDLVCHFGVPARIITDNSTQFTSRAFMQYVHALGCKISFASMALPGAMDKLRGRTLKCFVDSRQELSIHFRSTTGGGSRSCR